MSDANGDESYLKKEKINEPIDHSLSEEKDNKNEEEQFNYYNEFCRLYLTNTILTAQLKELSI